MTEGAENVAANSCHCPSCGKEAEAELGEPRMEGSRSYHHVRDLRIPPVAGPAGTAQRVTPGDEPVNRQPARSAMSVGELLPDGKIRIYFLFGDLRGQKFSATVKASV